MDVASPLRPDDAPVADRHGRALEEYRLPLNALPADLVLVDAPRPYEPAPAAARARA